jgi:hypothetical protein
MEPLINNATPTGTNNKPSIVDDFMYGSNVANSHVTVRLGFIRKVYGILAAQLSFTTLVGIVMMNSPSLSGFIKEK